jgi:DNA-binding transcriptional ArsR family regulator
MAKTVAEKTDEDKVRINEKKWTKPLWAAGWSGIPNIIIERQKALGLDPIDMNIILHLTQYWWRADNPPSPSVKTIADALGLGVRTIQKRITALEAADLIERVERREGKFGSQTNQYKLDGLITAATPFAEEKLVEIDAKRKLREARLASKKPKLKLVKSE